MRHSLVAQVLILIFAIAACGPASSGLQPASGPMSDSARRDTSAVESPADGRFPALKQVAATGASSAEATANQGSTVQSNVPRLDRMIVANVSLTLAVENAVLAARSAERVAQRYGGFVAGSNVRDNGSTRDASLTLRIPTSSLSDALADLRIIGDRVADESISTQDVTEEFTDVESNLRNLRATEGRILGFMERASKMDELLVLQRELTGIRGQIERQEGRRRVLDNRANDATITLKLSETVPAKVEGWNALTTLTAALNALAGLGQRLANVAIWLAVFSPIYGIPLALLWFLVRRLWALPPRPSAS